jgi:hypothetical protein
LVLADRRLFVVASRGLAGALRCRLEPGRLFGMLARLLGVTFSLDSVVLGLTAMLVGGAARFLSTGDVRVGLVAVGDGLSRQSFLLDFALGVTTARHRGKEGDDNHCRDDDDDD